MKSAQHKISVAPMMDWTDRHCRYFLRLISKQTLLYTEMITTGALLHGDRKRFLQFHDTEHPVAIQLGGSDPKALAECAKMAEAEGYDEVNLNVGCPSDRVQSGEFGLCLMGKPQLVADSVAAMKAVVKIPVTVKTRIGFDHQDSYEQLHAFVKLLIQHDVDHVCIHARKGWLQGLSPKENREIPPLNYPTVYQIKRDFPNLNIGINGGITDLSQAAEHLKLVDQVMMGRAAYHDPYILAEVDQKFYDSRNAIVTRHEIIEQLIPYIDAELKAGARLNHITRHILGLFHGEPHARAFRRHLSEHAHLPGANSKTLLDALQLVEPGA
jgi:tRNA-dihydrouridine synthase A